MKNNIKDVLIISLKLLVICAIVAVIVASVNLLTAPKIAENLKVSTAVTLTEIYKNDPSFSSYFENGAVFSPSGSEYAVTSGDEVLLSCSDVDADFISDEITNLYVLKDKDGNSLGYCVASEPMGYKDAVKLLISIDSEAVVKSVKIVDIKDTKGIGTRAVDDPKPPSGKNVNRTWFLDQFTGLGGDEVTEDDIQPIAKATKTSKPIVNAVKTAVEQINLYISENGGAK